MTDNTYHYAGHVQGNNKANRLNPFRYIQLGGEWVVQVGYGKNEGHFLINRASLPLLLNLPASLVEETPLTLPDGTVVSTYRLQDALVPTWKYRDAGIVRSKNPSDPKAQTQLARLLLGMKGPGHKVQFVNKQDKLDYRLSNLTTSPSHAGGQGPRAVDIAKAAKAQPIHWPHATDPNKSYTIRALTDCVIIQAFPGFQQPEVNPYWLVEYEGHRFYRMQALRGELFYFDEADFDRVCRGPDGKPPTWYKTTTGSKSKEGYIACHGSMKQPVLLHHYLTNRIGEQPDGLTVDHINWHKWDNRQQNLVPVPQSEQNRNRGKKARASTAAPLPEGILQSEIPVYVTPELKRSRFALEGHPLQTRVWKTTGAANISMRAKLDAMKAYISEMEALGAQPAKADYRKTRGDAAPLPKEIPEANKPQYMTWTRQGRWTVERRHPVLKAAGKTKVASTNDPTISATAKLMEVFDKLRALDVAFEPPTAWQPTYETHLAKRGSESADPPAKRQKR